MENNGTLYNVQRWIVHEKYEMNLENSTLKNDIALIRTATTIVFNDLVAPIALHRRFLRAGVRAVTSGWGQTNVSSTRNSQSRNQFQETIFHEFGRTKSQI